MLMLMMMMIIMIMCGIPHRACVRNKDRIYTQSARAHILRALFLRRRDGPKDMRPRARCSNYIICRAGRSDAICGAVVVYLAPPAEGHKIIMRKR